MIEILAPAGDKQCAIAAINAGADAIYLGLTDFSARSSAANFGDEDFREISALARLFGVKIYVAMNTLVKQSELEDFVKTAVKIHNAGADAIILQDIFLGAYLKERYPQMVLHLSTQAGVCNAYGARLAKELGFSRVIAARETRVEDLKSIAGIIETEAFVQGALCTCFSGQCYLSSFAGGNSGNRGKCKQPCRKRYSIDRSGFEESRYAISLSDLSLGEDIFKLIEAGVTSFKIEGRMRRPEYVSAAVKYYKKILLESADGGDLSALKRTYNRGNYTKGLAFGQDRSFISSAVQGHIGEYLGTVKITGGRYFCASAQKRAEGDGFKILREGKELCGAAFAGNAKGGFYLSAPIRLRNGDKVFITTDSALNKRLLGDTRRFPVTVNFKAEVNGFPQVTVNGMPFTADFKAEEAKNKPLCRVDVINCFNKIDTYPFEVSYGVIDIKGDMFIPVSAMNNLRRQAYAQYFAAMTESNNEIIGSVYPLPDFKCGNPVSKTAVIARSLAGVNADIGILKPDDYFADLNPLCQGFAGEKFLYLPPFLTGGEIERLKDVMTPFDGIYCGGNYSITLAKELGKKLFAGTGFNITNTVALSHTEADYVALSKELTVREAAPLRSGNTFYLTCGDIKVMDIIYCPFSKTCAQCDKRAFYNVTDEDSRVFPLRRYEVGECRFELYNCRPLAGKSGDHGGLYDFTLGADAAALSRDLKDSEKIKEKYGSYTKGHSENPVF